MIAIVTDSTAYLTRAEARKMGVSLAPMTYTCDGSVFHETYVDQNGAFESIISSGKLTTTSQTILSTFLSIFEELLQKGYDILCLTISSRLSGTYSSASIAARQLESDRIHLVDTHMVAGGMYLMIAEADRLIRAGLPAGEIAERLRQMRENVGTVFSVSDMGPLRRSGRLSAVRQSVGTILNIRPVFRCVEGGVVFGGSVRGRYEQVRQMAAAVPPTVRRLIVQHIEDARLAQMLVSALEQKFPGVPLEVRRGGPVLAIHLGLGVCSVAWEDGGKG